VNSTATRTTASATPPTARCARHQRSNAPRADIIRFVIGTGQKTIAPVSALPAIVDPVTIDGTTQPGFRDPDHRARRRERRRRRQRPVHHGRRQSGDGARRQPIRAELSSSGGNGILLEGRAQRGAGCYIGTNVAGTAAPATAARAS
jgi:hypothetical protein